jgi:hypothetical protein
VRRQGDPKRGESRLRTQDGGETQGRDGLAMGQPDEPASSATDEPQDTDTSESPSHAQPRDFLVEQILNAPSFRDISGDERAVERPNAAQENQPTDTSEVTPLHDGPTASTSQPVTNPTPATTPEPQAQEQSRPTGETNDADTETPSAADDPLVLRLLDHHRSPHGEAQHKPLSLAQLASDLGWNRTRVQRAMTDLFGPKPFTAYKERCKDRTIAEVLNQLTADGTETLIAPACTTM